MLRWKASAHPSTISLVNMNIRNSPLVFALLLASLAASAQQPASAPPQTQPPAAAAADSVLRCAPQPDRADAYYHFQLGHMYEEMVAGTGRAEFATKAVEEYKPALQADPSSSYLASALAELYARTGEIREAVAEAQNVISPRPGQSGCAPFAGPHLPALDWRSAGR